MEILSKSEIQIGLIMLSRNNFNILDHDNETGQFYNMHFEKETYNRWILHYRDSTWLTTFSEAYIEALCLIAKNKTRIPYQSINLSLYIENIKKLKKARSL